MNKKWYRGLQDLVGLCVFCFKSPHLWVLAVLMLLLWVGGAIADYCCFAERKDLYRSLYISLWRLYDFSAIGAAPSFCAKIISLIMFLFVWMIGSGVLLTVLVDRTLNYYKLIHGGQVRYNCLLRKFVVILGWDTMVISHLREFIDYNSYLITHGKAKAKISTVVILSAHPVEDIADQLKTMAFPMNKNLEIILYRGVYDSQDELKALNIEQAREIYIVGEKDDAKDINDTRVLFAMRTLDDVMKNKVGSDRKCGGFDKIPCYVWISKFELYHKLYRENVGRVNKYFDVHYLNIYKSWAHRFCGVLPSVLTPCCYEQPLFSIAKHKCIRILVVGFSQLGQAIVESILRSGYLWAHNSNCGGGAVKTTPRIIIDIIDKRLYERKEIFEKIFPSLIHSCLPGVEFRWNTPIDVHSSSFMQHVRAVYRLHCSHQEQLAIVFALAGADDMMSMALSACDVVNDSVPIFIRQNSFRSNTIGDVDFISPMPGKSNMYSIASAYYTGYNRWKCVELLNMLPTGGDMVPVTMEYCESAISAFVALGYSLSEDENESLNKEEILRDLALRQSLYKCKVMEELLATQDVRHAELEWEYKAEGKRDNYEVLQDVLVDSLLSMGYAFKPIKVLESVKDNGRETTGTYFWREYSVQATEMPKLIERIKNPYIDALKSCGEEIGGTFVKECKEKGIGDIKYVIGGSLVFGAVLKERYDIDLRLLVNGVAVDQNGDVNRAVQETLDKVKLIIADQFKDGEIRLVEKKDVNGKSENYIWKLRRRTRVPNIPHEIILECNVEAAGSYLGLARVAQLLPQDVKDRLLVAKDKAIAVGEKEYKDLKRHWKNFLTELKADGIEQKQDVEAINAMLGSYEEDYPIFLRPRI